MGCLAESPSAPESHSLAAELPFPLRFLLVLAPLSVYFLSHMANPQSVIADAFEKLKRSISEEDARNFASTELKDVWSAVREIDGKQRKRQSAQNLRRNEPLLRGIEKYTKVIEVLCNGTPYMPYVWVRTHSATQWTKSLRAFRLRSS